MENTESPADKWAKGRVHKRKINTRLINVKRR